MKPFIATVSAGLLGIMALNASVDPAHRFLQKPRIDLSSWSGRGKDYAMPLNSDDREFRAAHLVRIDQPDLVLFGSSTGSMVDSSMFKTVFYNAYVSGASVEDYAALWERLRGEGKTPRRLLIVADPWIFNENSSQARWESYSYLVERFARRRMTEAPGLGGLWRRLLKRRLVEASGWMAVRDLLSWGMLKATWSALVSGAADPDAKAGVPPKDIGVWSWDGSLIRRHAPQTRAQLREKVAAAAAAQNIYALDHYRVGGQAVALLEQLLHDAAAAGTQVMIVTPPHHPILLEALASRPSYKDALPAYFATLERAASRAPASLCSAIDSKRIGCVEDEFIDGTHVHPSCLRKALRFCLSKEASWVAALR